MIKTAAPDSENPRLPRLATQSRGEEFSSRLSFVCFHDNDFVEAQKIFALPTRRPRVRTVRVPLERG